MRGTSEGAVIVDEVWPLVKPRRWTAETVVNLNMRYDRRTSYYDVNRPSASISDPGLAQWSYDSASRNCEILTQNPSGQSGRTQRRRMQMEAPRQHGSMCRAAAAALYTVKRETHERDCMQPEQQWIWQDRHFRRCRHGRYVLCKAGQ